MQHQGWVVEQVLRHREQRLPLIESDCVIVDLLDGPVRIELGAQFGVALVVLLTGVVVDDLETLEQANNRGSQLLVEKARQVPDDMVCGQLVAIRPFDALFERQGPDRQVVVRLPLLQQPGTRDIVGPGAGQIVTDLPADVGVKYP